MNANRRNVTRLGYALAWALIACLAAVRLGGLIPALSAAPLAEGQRLALNGVDFSHHARSVIVVVSTHCRFCSANMDFYRSLAESEAVQDQRVGLVAGGWESQAALDKYLRDHGVGINRFAVIAAKAVRGTPTLLIVDRNGTILTATVGELGRQAQQAFMSALLSDAASPNR